MKNISTLEKNIMKSGIIKDLISVQKQYEKALNIDNTTNIRENMSAIEYQRLRDVGFDRAVDSIQSTHDSKVRQKEHVKIADKYRNFGVKVFSKEVFYYIQGKYDLWRGSPSKYNGTIPSDLGKKIMEFDLKNDIINGEVNFTARGGDMSREDRFFSPYDNNSDGRPHVSDNARKFEQNKLDNHKKNHQGELSADNFYSKEFDTAFLEDYTNNRKYTSHRSNHYILIAPRKNFDKPVPTDPMLFYQIADGQYALVHKWGSDVGIVRSFLSEKWTHIRNTIFGIGWMYNLIPSFILTILLNMNIKEILQFFLSKGLIDTSVQANSLYLYYSSHPVLFFFGSLYLISYFSFQFYKKRVFKYYGKYSNIEDGNHHEQWWSRNNF